MQLVGLAVVRGLVEDSDRLGLDRDSAFTLELHRVEHLGPHQPRVDGMGELEDAVGQRRLAVVDVGDDREVADVSLIGHVLKGISDSRRPGYAPPRRRSTSDWIW